MKTLLSVVSAVVVVTGFFGTLFVTLMIDDGHRSKEGYSVRAYVVERYLPEHREGMAEALAGHLADVNDLSEMREKALLGWVRGSVNWAVGMYGVREHDGREFAVVPLRGVGEGTLGDGSLVIVDEQLCVLVPVKKSRPNKIFLLWEGSDKSRTYHVDESAGGVVRSEIVADGCFESLIWSGDDLSAAASS